MNDLARIIKDSYDQSFTRVNIKAGFRKTGLCPFDPKALLSHAMPADSSTEERNCVLSPNSLMVLYEKKIKGRLRRRESEVVVTRGTLDKSSGVTLTSERALSAIKKCREKKKETWLREKARRQGSNEKREAKERKTSQLEEAALKKLALRRPLRKTGLGP